MSYSERLRAAHERYGYRSFSVLLYRIFFQWPRFRSAAVALKIRLLLRSKISRRAVFGRNIAVSIPGGFLEIGPDTYIGDRCVFEVSANPDAEVRIGSGCFFAHDVHLGSFGRITIGNNVRIAEFTSIRDTSHNYSDPHTPINEQGDTVGSIIIQDDVWLGKGCLVLGCTAGTLIGRGAVIGAHAVVKESIPDFAIAVGIPAKVIGYRGSIETRARRAEPLIRNEA